MAGVSTKEIKNRIRSMESTKQITKAMEMVAASKLRQAQNRITASRPYFEILSNTISDIVATNRDFTSPYLRKREGNRVLFVVIAGDRGLAGGYNSNILKMVMAEMQGKDATVLPIGKKALEYYRHRGVSIFSDAYGEVEDFGVGCAMHLAEEILRAFLEGAFSRVVLIYTEFTSMMTQTPKLLTLLPLSLPEGAKASDLELYEETDELLARILPDYIGGMIYGTVCEAIASENGARRSAMNAANKNAGELIDALSLHYNRARQAAITQEITEIVSGAEAL